MALIQFNQVSVRFPLLSSRAARHAPQGAGRLETKRDRTTVIALDGVTMELSDGDRVALIGRNGAGKTTFLKVAAGIYPPSSGAVIVKGKIGALLALGFGVRIDATGRRNIILRAMMAGLKRVEAEKRVDEIAEFAELGDFIDLPLRSYSSGMLMRLSFAVATSFQPEILLLDETVGAGDAKFIEKAKRRIETLIETAGISVIASHSPDFVMSTCNKAIWMHEGSVREVGEPSEILQLYKSF
jgi:lipopolysaccharide transport system ATP-binding protein